MIWQPMNTYPGKVNTVLAWVYSCDGTIYMSQYSNWMKCNCDNKKQHPIAWMTVKPGFKVNYEH